MKLFKNIFLALLLLTSLDLTQTFAMEPDPNEENLAQMGQIEQERLSGSKRGREESDDSNKRRRASHDDDDEESDDDSDSVNIVPEAPIEKKFILECEDAESKITLEIPKNIANQSLMLGSIINSNFKESVESFLDVSQITNPDTIFILNKLIKLAYQTAQSQDTVDLKSIIQVLHNEIYKIFDTEQINDFKNIADYFQIPLIQEAIENSNNNSPFGLIIRGFIPLSIINKALGLDPKSLDFYTIEKNIKTNKQLCEKISNLLLSNTDDKFYLSQFLKQIPSEFFKNYLCNKIKNILEHTKINENFNLTPDLRMLLSPKIFLRFLLVLPEEDLNPFLDKLSLLVTNNQLEGYELALAQARLCINNHEKKDNILSQLGIIRGEELINNATDNRELDLSNNYLGNSDNLNKFLFYIAIAQILNVTNLDLSYNNLTSLPDELCNLTNLTKLDLHVNKLTSLPPEIRNLTNLTSLNLYSNKLTSLPSEIRNLTNLRVLNLDNNNLTSLPAEIRNLTNLTSLNLYSNKLTSLPSEIRNLTNLRVLNLDNNNLTSLPAEICNLTRLTYLDLQNNNLTSLPPEIRNLTRLTYLNLYSNKLTSLPDEICNLTRLTYLNLQNNNLTSLPPEIRNLLNRIFM
ncbi:MAG: leucine-rich repeat domain-containing protein [Candidatus Babeliales bacterium]